MSYNCVVCYNELNINFDTIRCKYCNDLIICENCDMNIENDLCPLCRTKDFRLSYNIIEVINELDYFKTNINIKNLILGFSASSKCKKCDRRMILKEVYILDDVEILCKMCNLKGINIKKHLEVSIKIEEQKRNKKFGIISVAKYYIDNI